MNLAVGQGSWEHFDHAADMGICARGGTLEETFEQAALGMMAVITDAAVAPTESVPIRCQAPDAELLLVDWLNALIYEMATRGLLFGAFDVRIETTDAGLRLHGTARGERVNTSKHRPAVA